jgi:hypothetical protein
MTKAQCRKYNKLRDRQVNRDVMVIETSESSITFFVPFPGLYLTYDNVGGLLLTETDAQRRLNAKTIAIPGQQPTLTGEMG